MLTLCALLGLLSLGRLRFASLLTELALLAWTQPLSSLNYLLSVSCLVSTDLPAPAKIALYFQMTYYFLKEFRQKITFGMTQYFQKEFRQKTLLLA